MPLVNLLLFLLPFIAAVAVALQSGWLTLLKGIIIIVATPVGLSLVYPIEKLAAKTLDRRALSYLLPVWYFVLVACSITVCWLLLNADRRGDWRFFLFAWSVCYVPYTYMLQREAATTGRVNLMTNVTNNFAVLGYAAFGSLANFTPAPLYVAVLAACAITAFLMIGLPRRIQALWLSVENARPNA